MMRSLFSAISGLRNHMVYMDVVGNNIANVNTTAFKSNRVTFMDALGQTLRGAGAPQGGLGGTNPVQVGLGMFLGGTDTMHTQGSLTATGKITDFAIQGDGFFILNDGNRNFYSRDGAFDVAVNGDLVNPVTGLKVMGWNADATGAVDLTQPLQVLRIPFGTGMAASQSSNIALSGNLDASTPTAGTVSSTVNVYDSLGGLHTVTLTFTKNAAANTWDITLAENDPAITSLVFSTGSPTQLVFNSSGQLTTPANGNIQVDLVYSNGAANQTTTINFSDVTQYVQDAQLITSANDGFAPGSLVTFSVSKSGVITGMFTNGATQTLGQLALANFTNPAGLGKIGNNLYETTANSGQPLVGTPNTGGRGVVTSGNLEGSNVDLAREFTNVIIAQRGFQSNSRVITASDEMLQDLVNIKR
ncbi:MAG TPA: flagellar hook protein FlgE [Dehalococcoidia bacterium]